MPVVVVPGLSPFGTVLFGHDGGRWMSRGDIGATHDSAQRGSLSERPGECHAIDWFCQNVVGPPERECKVMGFVVWVQCTNLCRVYNLSIAASSVMDTVCSRSHHGSTEIINLHTNVILMVHAMVGNLV